MKNTPETRETFAARLPDVAAAGTVVVPSLVPDRQVTVSAPKGHPPGHVELAVLVDGAPTAAVLSPDQALDVAAAVTRAIEGGESR